MCGRSRGNPLLTRKSVAYPVTSQHILCKGVGVHSAVRPGGLAARAGGSRERFAAAVRIPSLATRVGREDPPFGKGVCLLRRRVSASSLGRIALFVMFLDPFIYLNV